MSNFDIAAQPASTNCRLINYEKAQVVPGIIPGTWFLVVSGTKPCANMDVSLSPLVYIRCPEYWGIEVMGCLPHGICLPMTAPYVEAIPLAGITGSSGIEVIGANRSEKFEVKGGCSANS